MSKKLYHYTISHEGRQFPVDSPSVRDLLTYRFWEKGLFYEEAILRQIRKMCGPGVYFDGGANLGNHSIYFANFCQCTKLISVEAVPAIYHIMTNNVTRNLPEAVAFVPANWALHSMSSMLARFDPPDEKNLGGTRMQIRERTHDDTMPSPPPHSIMTQRIDDLVLGTDNVVLLKLDVEGGEVAAIMGGVATIQRCRPLIVAESQTKEQLSQMDQLLRMLGYERLKLALKRHTYFWKAL
jgi:FkbM family methyltransferase